VGPARRGTTGGRFAAGLLAVLATAACSGGGASTLGSTAEQTATACALAGRLHQIAEPLASIDVADPDAFRRDFDAVVMQYVNTLDTLAESVPARLAPSVQRVERLVREGKYAAAATARVPVDDWLARVCR
jgi:hypothetical protein